MVNKKDISIVIQGPINEISLDNLNYYSSFGEVIISTWLDRPFNCDLKSFDNISVIAKPIPKTRNIYNFGNFYFQCQSSLQGLEVSKKKYSFKTRSDESFSNLDPFLFKDENKITTSNINFVKDNQHKYHPSDHLIFGKTNTLIKTFRKCVKMCESPKLFNLSIEGDNLVGVDAKGVEFKIHAEKILGINFCETMLKKEPLMERSKEDMKKCFEIVPLSELGSFKFSANSSRHNKNAPYYQGVKEDWFTGNSIYPNSIKEI